MVNLRYLVLLILNCDAYISFAGPFRVCEALLLGITKRFWLVGWSAVRSDLTLLQLEDPYQTYMVGRWYPTDDARPFLGVKRSKGQKQGFRLKSISSFSFLARAFKFSECVVLT